MSNQSQKAAKRPYRKRRRAAAEAETRRRITAATAELHGTVGPARTTVSAIAQHAGVQRATVYRHFPDDASLFEACSAHWMAANAPPDPGGWAQLGDPDERLRVALGELYAWFERTEHMLENLFRDAPLLPSLAAQLEVMGGYFEAVAESLMAGRRARGAHRRLLAAAIGHALGFDTWRSLVRVQSLTTAEAVELMARLVTEA